MVEITPYVSCFARPDEFEAALASDYSEIFTIGSDGSYLKHIKLTAGRSVRFKIPSLPKNVVDKISLNVLTPDLTSFLPAGKIPFELFEQIVAFFKEIMKLHKAENEAHAWILWNKDDGYHVSIPKQVVSKASVRYEYDQTSLPPGSVIVFDVHSHNTMGAFFSGTDNNDDKKSIGYSAVVGKLKDKTPEVKVRFNAFDVKIDVTMDDIFATQETEWVIPKEWVENVTELRGGTRSQGNVLYPTRGQGTQGTFQGLLGSNLEREQAALWGHYHEDLMRSFQVGQGYQRPETKHQNQVNQESRNFTEVDPKDVKEASKVSATVMLENQRQEMLSEIEGHPNQVELAKLINSQIDDAIKSSTGPLTFMERVQLGLDAIDDDDEDDPVGAIATNSGLVDVDLATSSTELVPGVDFTKDGEYDYYAAQHGVKVANTLSLVKDFMSDLSDCDDALVDIIREAHSSLGEKGRTELAQNGF